MKNRRLAKVIALYISTLAYKTILVSIFLTLRASMFVLEWFASEIENICVMRGWVYFLENPEGSTTEITPTFSDNELKIMAEKIKSEDLTIQEISRHFGISYRQGRKVKSEVDKIKNSPNIRGISIAKM